MCSRYTNGARCRASGPAKEPELRSRWLEHGHPTNCRQVHGVAPLRRSMKPCTAEGLGVEPNALRRHHVSNVRPSPSGLTFHYCRGGARPLSKASSKLWPLPDRADDAGPDPDTLRCVPLSKRTRPLAGSSSNELEWTSAGKLASHSRRPARGPAHLRRVQVPTPMPIGT